MCFAAQVDARHGVPPEGIESAISILAAALRLCSAAEDEAPAALLELLHTHLALLLLFLRGPCVAPLEHGSLEDVLEGAQLAQVPRDDEVDERIELLEMYPPRRGGQRLLALLSGLAGSLG